MLKLPAIANPRNAKRHFTAVQRTLLRFTCNSISKGRNAAEGKTTNNKLSKQLITKVSAVNNLTDARYFAAKEVDYLGFNIEEGTPGYLDPMYMKAIREWVAGPKIVGEFRGAPMAHVGAAQEFFGLDAVQLTAENHGDNLQELPGVEIILQVNSAMDTLALERTFRNAAPYVACFLLDFTETTNWEAILTENSSFWNELFALRPTLLQADVSAEQLPKLMQKFKLGGLSLVGGEEEQVGVKSFDEMDEIFEALELYPD